MMRSVLLAAVFAACLPGGLVRAQPLALPPSVVGPSGPAPTLAPPNPSPAGSAVAPAPAPAEPQPAVTPDPLEPLLGDPLDLPTAPDSLGLDDFNAATSTLAFAGLSAPNMLGDFFGRGGVRSIVLASLNELGVADDTPGIQSPQGPFNIVSIVDPVVVDNNGDPTTLYFYRNGPPVPFGDFTIDSAVAINDDEIPDFELSSPAFPEDGVNGSDLVAVSNGDVTPSTHDVYELYEVVQVVLPSPGAGDFVGRVRLQDNNSALPTNRVFFDYNFFNNVPLSTGGIDVNRFTPGVEKTWGDGIGSFELRVPMAVTLGSDLVAGGPVDASAREFGNVALATKVILTQGRDALLSAGLGVSLPTADDVAVRDTGGASLLRIENEAVHLLPYLAFLYAPEGRSHFAQAFVTLDVDTGGNPVIANTATAGMRSIGRWNDQTLGSIDVAVGSWLYEAASSRQRLRRVGWSGELHYTATLDDADSVAAAGFLVGDPNGNLSVLNGTLGAHAVVGQTTFTLGVSAPLTDQDRVFDGEFRFFVNRGF